MDLGQAIHYIAERYCVLCRNKLPFFTYVSIQLRGYKPWEMAVLGFVDLNVNPRLAPQVFTFKANLDDPTFICNPTFNLTNAQGDRKTVVIFNQRLYIYRSAFFVHLSCWKFSRTLEPKLSCLDFYNLATQLSEIIPRDCWKKPDPWHLASFSNGVAIRDTKLRSWLLKCAQLPMEMQHQILSQVHNDKFAFSLLTALQTHSLSGVYSSALLPYPNSIRSLIPDFDTDVVHLCASFVNLLGHNYLYRVGIFDTSVRHDTWNHHHMEVKIHKICKVEFTVGLIGILAVRFYFRDGSTSPWWGASKQGWRCGPLDVNLSDVKLLKNDHKCVLKQFTHFVDRNLDRVAGSQALPIRVFWEGARNLSPSGESFIAAMYQKQLPNVLRCFPGQMMCRYLPLQQDGHHIKGMTVYTSYYGTSSINLHGRNSDIVISTSNRRGSPTSFYFSEGEEIVTIGLVIIGLYDVQFGPYLMFKTNLQRLAYFGPPLLLADASTRYMPLIPDRLRHKCSVMGFTVDHMAVVNDSFKTIGVHCKPREDTSTTERITSLPERQVSVSYPPKLMRLFPFNSGANMTIAKLANIKQLRVQKRPADDADPNTGLRYAGLWIYHTDESIETLGLWDGSAITPSELIYDSETDGHLLRLIFRLTRGGRWRDRPHIAYYMSSIVVKSVQGRGDIEEPQDPSQPQESQEGQELQQNQEPQETQEPQQLQETQQPPEPQELQDEDTEPAEKVIDWEISPLKPSIVWCFTEWVDHVEACSTKMRNIKLAEYDTRTQLRMMQ